MRVDTPLAVRLDWLCHTALATLLLATVPPGLADRVEAPAGTLRKLSLEELMDVKVETQSTVSRVDEKIDEAPGSVYVFTRKMIQERGYRSLGDLLQTVPGFTVFHRDLDFVAGVRGLNANDNEKITLLINGENVNGAHEQDFSLNGPINMDTVERVEVVVGPSSFFQQANTLAATINVITKDVEGIEAIAAAGSALRYSATLMGGHHWAPDKFVSLSFTTESIRGFDAWNRDFQPGLAGRRITGELEQPSFFGVLKGQYGELTGQIVAYRASWPELHIDNGSPNNDGTMFEQLYSFVMKDEHQWTDNLTSVARFDTTYKEQTRVNHGGTPMGAEEQSIKQVVFTGELGLQYKGFQHQFLQGGIQASYDDNVDNWWTFHAGSERFSKTPFFDQSTFAIGFYVDDTIEVTKWLKLIEGVRIDENGRLKGDRWYPGARSAIILEPTPNWITKLIYNRSVRMPSSIAALNQYWGINHLATSPSFARVSDQAQQPEVLSTFELQEILYLGKIRLAGTVYHEELSNFISFFSPHANGGNFRGNGVELSLQAPITQRFSVWANGSWNDTMLNLFNNANFGTQPQRSGNGVESFHSYVNGAGRLIGSAAYTANVGFDWKIADHLTLSPGLRYFSEQAAVNFDAAGSNFAIVRNQFYLDAGLTWDHVGGRDLDLRLSGRNLLDNRGPVAAQQQGDTYRPRGIEGVFTVDVRF